MGTFGDQAFSGCNNNLSSKILLRLTSAHQPGIWTGLPLAELFHVMLEPSRKIIMATADLALYYKFLSKHDVFPHLDFLNANAMSQNTEDIGNLLTSFTKEDNQFKIG